MCVKVGEGSLCVHCVLVWRIHCGGFIVEDSVWRIQRQDWGGDAGRYSGVNVSFVSFSVKVSYIQSSVFHMFMCSVCSMQYAVFSVCTWAEMRISEGETSRIPVT